MTLFVLACVFSWQLYLGLVFGLVFVLLFTAWAYARPWPWTGFSDITPGKKTLWDWLQLLGIPVALAGLAFLLNSLQSDRDHKAALDSAREETLRGYIAQMSGLILDHGLLSSHRDGQSPRTGPASDILSVARTVTITSVRRLDGARKGQVVRFLSESGLLKLPPDASLISGKPPGELSIFAADRPAHSPNPGSADLRDAKLEGAYLKNANFDDADLRGADLEGADLEGAHLQHADLRGADLRFADMFGAALQDAYLQGANASGAVLYAAKLQQANVTGTDVTGAKCDLAGSSFMVMVRAHAPASIDATGLPNPLKCVPKGTNRLGTVMR